ncbi:hypothetical protein A4S05_28900 [Nostoc sp. KVJ20]|uniref:hypothetical protein n=1 Tax=Nostoc sp. KVJ20 TaxID=457944 RepID=UPI00083E5E3A|nr:hypothetical protein [Nostoc sp. KVJ20]ODH01431.1 hypothetical protein A4S05_28900 [Nostoc sp. KVJ20]
MRKQSSILRKQNAFLLAESTEMRKHLSFLIKQNAFLLAESTEMRKHLSFLIKQSGILRKQLGILLIKFDFIFTFTL